MNTEAVSWMEDRQLILPRCVTYRKVDVFVSKCDCLVKGIFNCWEIRIHKMAIYILNNRRRLSDASITQDRDIPADQYFAGKRKEQER